jgi:hypothetical protein
MTVQSRSTLKSYFITGASPSEDEFADLIDSTLLVGDIEVGLASTSSVNPLSASAGKTLNDKISDITSRVIVLEDTENTFASNYYNKSEVDNLITAVDQVIVNLTYQSQINDLQDQIDNIDTTGSPSSISIGDVTGLQDVLDAKATIAELNSTRDALQASIDSINTDGVDLSGIEQSIATLDSEIDALETALVSKASSDHTHSQYYTKTEVDTLVGDISVEDHTHTASDITDLNQEIEQKTTLLVSDHSDLINNPHNVTKAQVGLDKVENLTPSEIVTAAGVATDESLADIEQQLLDHASEPNPHGTSKSDIGLGNVPNVNVQQLLDLHLQAENPHNVDLNFFDVYSTAEADSRMQFYIDSVRYAFTPTYSGDSAGALGDIAWDDDFLYFKQQPTKWVKVPFSSIEEFNLDNVTKISAADIEVTGTDGSTLLSVSDAGVEIGEGSIGSLTISDYTRAYPGEEGETTLLESENQIQISSDKVLIRNVKINHGTIAELDLVQSREGVYNYLYSGQVDLDQAYILNTTTPSIKISNLNWEFDPDVGLRLVPEHDNPAEFTYSYDLDRWTSTVGSNLKKFAYLADLPDLSPYALKSDLPSNIGQGGDEGSNATDVVLSGSTGGLDNYAYTPGAGVYADDPDTPGDQEYWAFSDEILSTGLVIDYGYGVNNPSIKYNPATEAWEASDGVNTFGIIAPYTKDEIDSLIAGKADSDHTHSQYALSTDLLTFVPYTQPEVDALLANKANAVHTHAQYALSENLPDFNTYALKTDLSDYATLEDLSNAIESIDVGTTTTTEAIFDNFITLDSSAGGAREGYAFTEGAGVYADDPNTPGEQEYWALAELAYYDAGLNIDIGQGVNNPYIKWNIANEEWEVSNGTTAYKLEGYSRDEVDALIQDFEVVGHTHSQYALKTELLGYFPYTTDEVDALISNVESSKADTIHYHNDLYAPLNHTHSQYALTTDIPDLSNYATLSDLASIDTGTSDTGGLFEGTITIDSATTNTYAETKYPDGSGGFISEKYSIDYGADGQYGTADDDDSQDYFTAAAIGYSKTGMVVDVGQFANNPSIKYDPDGDVWEVFDGASTFDLKDVDIAIANLVDSAPNTLDTLNELAAALGDDPNFATTTSTALGNRVRVDINNQGLSSTQKSNARTNIGAQVAGSYAASSHNHSAANITSGTLGIARIPTGTTSSTVCRGDDSRLSDARTPTAHNHSATNITSGTLSISRIPTGTTSTTVCLGSDSRLSDARTPTSHTHDDRYYTEAEMRHILSRAHGWASAYGTSSELATNWSVVEDALEIDSTDSSIGATYKAIRIQKGDIVRFTVMVKGSAASGSGLYLRIYGDNALDDAKTHISITTGETDVQLVSTSSAGDEYPFHRWDWQENKPITTSWKDYTYNYVAHDDGFISLNVLNWSGHGTNSLFVKNPDIQVLASGQYSYAT